MTDTNHIEVLRAVRSVFDHIPQPCAERDALDAAIKWGEALSARASAGEGGHVGNEWADMAANGVQWLRNIRDGISTADEALAEMESNARRITAITAPQPAKAGASGGGERDGHVAYHLTDPGVRPCISAVIWNDESARPGKGSHVWLATPASPATGEEWRCFHCEEAFTDRDAAAIHFGTHEHQRPACLIDAAEYRRMEAQEARYAEEDADCHRAMHRQASEHQVALRRAEEAGYAKGLSDSGKCPCATPQPAAAQGGEWVTLPRKEWGRLSEAMDYLKRDCADIWWSNFHAARVACQLAAAPQPQEVTVADMCAVLDRIPLSERKPPAECQCALCDALNATPESRRRVHELIAEHPELFPHVTPPAHGDGEGVGTLKRVGWMRFKNGRAEVSVEANCPPNRSDGIASHWFAIHAYEIKSNV